ncbi:dermonecrotic toxin domain-containing protein [Pseudomonas costantinii]|uniref:dermonecrotic toxin domain-containing protein n=1 Tax=Pseudomonas costantinii TaxID=168469 RepID=UPI0015A30DAF|nr:DUF6543 domain-containing protein [Pseudomonas costantinii]NVZ73179.1 hypothetical protein [Pseudomonas costantinii]
MQHTSPLSTPLVTTLNARGTRLQTRLTQKILTLNTEIIERLKQQPTFARFVQDAFDNWFTALPAPIDLNGTFIKIASSTADTQTQEPAPNQGASSASTLGEASHPLLPNLMDAVVERIVRKTAASYATHPTTFHRSANGQTGNAPVLGLTPQAFDSFLDTLADTLAIRFKAHMEQFWNTPLSASDTRTCKQWLAQKRLELMKAEVELLKVDGVLDTPAELLLAHVARYPDALSRWTLSGYRPCAYGLAVKDTLSTDIPLYGALVLTARDQDDAKVNPDTLVNAPQVRELAPQVNVGQVLLYLPTSGFEAFDSLASLDLELHRRLNSPLEFADILALMSENDRASGLAFHQQQNASDQFRYVERLESIFSHSLDSLCERIDKDFTWMVAHYQRQANELDITQLPASLDRVTHFARIFDAEGSLVARQKKKVQRQLKQFLKSAGADDKQQWEDAVRDYTDELQKLYEQDGLPSLAQFSNRASLLSYSNKQLRNILEAEHGLTVDPDTIIVHTKTYANRPTGSYVPGGKPHPSAPGAPVFTPRTLTLTELALENIEWLDLNFIRFSRLTDTAQAPYTALTVVQVKDLVRTLNIGDSYEQFLKARLITSQEAQATQQCYTQVMALQLRVDALEAKIAGDFLPDRLDRGYQWVMSLLAGPVDDDKRRKVEEHRVIVSCLKLRGERVRGVLVFSSASQSVASRVVYTPKSKTGRLFHEYPDASAMHRDFINHSAWHDYLIERVGLSAQPRIRSVLKGGARDTVIALTRIADNFLEEAYQTEASAVINDANAQSTSTQEADYESTTTLVTAALDIATMILPVKVMLPIGLARSILSVINAVEAAQVGDRVGAAESIVRALGELVGAVIDGAAAGARSATKQILRNRTNRLDPKLSLSEKPKGVSLLKGWEEQHIYVRDIAESGTYQAPQHFLLENSRWYSIRRDNDALVWRLRDPRRAPSAYPGAPLFRNAQGLWEIRSPHLGLHGGAPIPSAAERALMDLFPYLDLAQARRVFDSFVFPRQRELELQMSLVQHLRSSSQLPAHTQYLSMTPERFRARLAGRDLPGSWPAIPVEPNPGPSRAPTGQPTASAAQPLRPAHERFVDWGQTLAADSLEAVPGRSGVWRRRNAVLDQALQEYIRIDNRYYPILRGDNTAAVQSARAVLVPNDRPCTTFLQFEEILHHTPFEQPRIVEYNLPLNTWLIAPQVPFQRPITRHLGNIFRNFTPQTLVRLGAALFNYANPTGLNAPGYALLINSLSDWSNWAARTAAGLGNPSPGVLGDPLSLLPRLQRTPNQNTWPLDLTEQFNIVRFRTDQVPPTLTVNASQMPTNATARDLMRALLVNSHYEVFDSVYPTELIFRRENQPTVYWMTILRTYTPEVSTRYYNPDVPTQANLRHQHSALREMVIEARDNGNLMVLNGGLQFGEGSALSPFIFRP